MSLNTTHKTNEDILKAIESFWDQFDSKLREYLVGPSWKTFWRAPFAVDSKMAPIASFINDIKIPVINGRPSLLLHSLGSDIVDPILVDTF